MSTFHLGVVVGFRIGRAYAAVYGVRILCASGLVDLTRPRLILRALPLTKRLGPIAGPAAISALRNPADVAVIDELGSVTYGELDRRSSALARGLSTEGLAAGDVVGLLCRDHRFVVEAMLAVGKLGARLVLLNTGFAEPQLRDVAAREGVRALLVDQEFAPLLDALPEVPVRMLAWVDDALAATYPSTTDLIENCSDAPLPLPQRQAGLVLLTGGTTGTPKGAPRRVQSPLAAAQFLERVPQKRGDVVLIAAPTFHGTGLSQFIIAFALGSTVVLQRRFDPLGTIENLARYRATVLILVPTMLNRILALGEETLEAHDTSSLRIMMSAGAALPTDLGNRATARFGDVIHNLYGCTEVALATVAMPEDWRAAPGTVGRPPHGIRVEVLDDDDRPIKEADRVGRIFVDNGLNFEGYSGGGNKHTVGRLMSTGDTGHWDGGGRLFVDGRDDDMIVSGGENVFPGEIEDLVVSMPGVADAATLPVADADFGTRLAMYVVADGSEAVSAEDVKAFVRTNLARFKVPREVHFLDEIPYTPTGKVDRRSLVALVPTHSEGVR